MFYLVTFTGVAILPWSLFISSQTDKVVLVSEGRLGMALWQGTWAKNGDWTKAFGPGEQLVFPREAFRTMSEKQEIETLLQAGKTNSEMEEVYRGYALDHILHDPLRVASVYLQRFPLFWYSTRIDIFKLRPEIAPTHSRSWFFVKICFWATNFLIVTFGLVGFLYSVYKFPNLLWLSLPIIYVSAIHFPLNSYENRFSQPVLPFVYFFTALGLMAVRNAIRYWMIRRAEMS